MVRMYRVAAEYGARSVWDDDWDGVREINPSAASLGASPELQAAFDAWELEWERTFDPTYPPDGGFVTEEEEVEFNLAGERLAARLQAELGSGVIVRYRPV